jgi:hypothetical protein
MKPKELKWSPTHCSAHCPVFITNYKEVDLEIDMHIARHQYSNQYFQTSPQKHTLRISQLSYTANVTMLPQARFLSLFWVK